MSYFEFEVYLKEIPVEDLPDESFDHRGAFTKLLDDAGNLLYDRLMREKESTAVWKKKYEDLQTRTLSEAQNVFGAVTALALSGKVDPRQMMTIKEFKSDGYIEGCYYRSSSNGSKGTNYDLFRERHHTDKSIQNAAKALRKKFDVASITVIWEKK